MPPSPRGLAAFFKKATPPKLPLTKKIFPKGMLPARGGTNPGKSLLANRPSVIKPPVPVAPKRTPGIPVRDTPGFPPTKEGRPDLKPMPRRIDSTLPAKPAGKSYESFGQQTIKAPSAATERARAAGIKREADLVAHNVEQARLKKEAAERKAKASSSAPGQSGTEKILSSWAGKPVTLSREPLKTSSRAQIDKLEVDRRVALAKKRAGAPSPKSIKSYLGQKPATKRVVPELSSVFYSEGQQGDKFIKGHVVGMSSRGQTGVAGSYSPGHRTKESAERAARQWNEQNVYRAPLIKGPSYHARNEVIPGERKPGGPRFPARSSQMKDRPRDYNDPRKPLPPRGGPSMPPGVTARDAAKAMELEAKLKKLDARLAAASRSPGMLMSGSDRSQLARQADELEAEIKKLRGG